MLETLKQWQLKRRMTRTIKDSFADHRGMAATVWPLLPASSPTERAQVARAAHQWLAAQLPYTATPYGISRYQIRIGYVQMEGTTRTFLSQDGFPPFNRAEAPGIFEQVHDHICTRDLAAFPQLTTLELYLLSYGDLLKPAFEE